MDSTAKPQFQDKKPRYDRSKKPDLSDRPKVHNFKPGNSASPKLRIKPVIEVKKSLPDIRQSESTQQPKKYQFEPKTDSSSKNFVILPYFTIVDESESKHFAAFSDKKIQIFAVECGANLIKEYNLQSIFPFNFIFSFDFQFQKIVFTNLNGLYLLDLSGQEQSVQKVISSNQIIQHVKISKNLLLIAQNGISYDTNGSQQFNQNSLILMKLASQEVIYHKEINGYINGIILEEGHEETPINLIVTYQEQNLVQIEQIVLTKNQNEQIISQNTVLNQFGSYLAGFDQIFQIIDKNQPTLFLFCYKDQGQLYIISGDNVVRIQSSKFTQQVGLPINNIQRIFKNKFFIQIGGQSFSFTVTGDGISNINKVSTKRNMIQSLWYSKGTIQILQNQEECIVETTKYYETRIQEHNNDIFL